MSEKQIVIEFEEMRTTSKKYKVTRLVNTIQFKIGEVLGEEQIELIISRPAFKVVIKPNRQQKG